MSALPVDHLFVYGSLMPGESRWSLLAPFVEGAPRRGEAEGLLYDTGFGFPALFAAGPGEVPAPVPGHLLRLQAGTVEQALALLDSVEGVAGGLFQRDQVRIDGTPAWIYLGRNPVLRGQPISRWGVAHA